MKPSRIIALSGLVVLGVAASALTVSWYTQRRGYESNYSQIKIGDSKEKLVDFYGQPSEITDCSLYKSPNYIDAVQKHCVEVYWYRALFAQQWIFFLDKHGTVVHKAYNVMY